MMSVLLAIVPPEYQETEKRFLYYLKTLKDKVYKKDIPEVSQYQVQIKKDLKGLTIVNHGHYKTEVVSQTWKQLEERLRLHFEKEDIQLPDEQKQFLLDLRF
ncbi:hypothetical protein [Flavobacterium sp. M31R6]|uniref:hypothetical protein n=1 Tax=Flavobacterium sp. M31R6 TaxID=2739062 RepID=UPI001568CA98|nr:hypothetical protein [Flavobacterium sp. M31R6]QKJ63826.1 hypothetical protein HQN62_12030 [Flavobacterium sp. M31R6]